MLRRLGHFLAVALALAALAAVGLFAGSYYRVHTAPAWESFAATDGSWSCMFPERPVMRVGPAPAPLTGEEKTWSVVTETASYEMTSFEPPPPVEAKTIPATAGPQPVSDELAYAALAANALEGQLEPGAYGYFLIRTPSPVAIRGRVVRGGDGRVYRLLAATRVDVEAGQASRLFLQSFRAR